MKKVIFGLLASVMFQQCTDELHEIDAVITTQSQEDLTSEFVIATGEVPLNSYSASYYYTQNQQEYVSGISEGRISHSFRTGKTIYNDLGVHWIGDFEFESGDYEISIKTDENIKVIVDDNIVFQGSGDNYGDIFKTKLSLNGIHRFRVFYNLSSEQKVARIIDYYKKLNEEKKEDVSNGNGRKASIFSDSINDLNTEDPDVSLIWRLL